MPVQGKISFNENRFHFGRAYNGGRRRTKEENKNGVAWWISGRLVGFLRIAYRYRDRNSISKKAVPLQTLAERRRIVAHNVFILSCSPYCKVNPHEKGFKPY